MRVRLITLKSSFNAEPGIRYTTKIRNQLIFLARGQNASLRETWTRLPLKLFDFRQYVEVFDGIHQNNTSQVFRTYCRTWWSNDAPVAYIIIVIIYRIIRRRDHSIWSIEGDTSQRTYTGTRACKENMDYRKLQRLNKRIPQNPPCGGTYWPE